MAEQVVCWLAERKYISVRINKVDGTVDFNTGTELSNEGVVRVLIEGMKESMNVSDQLRALQCKFLSSKAYVARMAPRSESVQHLPGEDYDMEYA